MSVSLSRTAARWLPLGFLATIACGLVYGAVQQSYRQSANDPQVQMARDAAAAVTEGIQAQSLVPGATVDIAQSLSPYIIFYNDQGAPVGGNGLLNGVVPTLPAGVFDYVRTYGEDRITWEPQGSVRDAIVVDQLGGSQPGFVMAGRSLQQVEMREDQLEVIVGGAWIVMLLGTFILCACTEHLERRKR